MLFRSTSSPGDSSIGMNIAYHELMNGSRFMIDPNKDVNEICAMVLAGEKNGCVILGGGSPKNFYLQAQPTLWEVYGIPKGGNEYFIQFTTDQVVWGGLSGATPAEAVSWGKVDPDKLPDSVTCYVDSTVALPLLTAYALTRAPRRTPKRLFDRFPDLQKRLEEGYARTMAERNPPVLPGSPPDMAKPGSAVFAAPTPQDQRWWRWSGSCCGEP